MATHDYVIANGTGAAVRSDLNDALAAIVSNNSGSSEPATTYAYQWWADTTANVLKIRNSANNAWITLRELDGTMLIEDGSASTPGLAFASDTDTGIFRGGANKINFATGGTERLEINGSEVVINDTSQDTDFRVESNGNDQMLCVDAGNDRVGIGTLLPKEVIDVRGAAVFSGDHSTNQNAFATAHGIMLSSTSNLASIKAVTNGSNNVAIRFVPLDSGSSFEAARIDSSGRLLVGTSSSSASSAAVFQGNSFGSGQANQVYFQRDTAGTGLSAGDGIGFLLFADNAGNVFSQIGCQADAATGSADYPGRLVFYTTADGASSPTERFRIDSEGTIKHTGLRSGNGQNKLAYYTVPSHDTSEEDVLVFSVANESSSNQITFGGGPSAYNAATAIMFRTASAVDTTVGSERMRIDSSGNVGIGTSSIASGGANTTNFNVHTPSANSVYLKLSNSSTGNTASDAFDLSADSSGNAYLINRENGNMAFYTNATERMRINNAGILNVGTTTVPDGGHQFEADSTNGNTGAFYVRNHDNDNSHCAASFSTAATSTGTANVLIKFGINDYASGSGQINANGASQCAFGSFSDERLKENITSLPSQWDNIKNLRPVEFDFIESQGGGHQIGFIAQEFETVYPDAVASSPMFVGAEEVSGEERLTITGWSKTEARLVKALQEAIAKIETLETKVAALEAG